MSIETGLHKSSHDHDACGVGFVADVGGSFPQGVLKMALKALDHLSHRGAVSADRLTGDGAGLLTAIPHELFRPLLPEPLQEGDLAVGCCFLWAGQEARRAEILAAGREEIERLGMRFLDWRKVPTDDKALGEEALSSRPEILHLLAARGNAGGAFERRLYLARRRWEKRFPSEELHVASLSSRTLVYKSMALADQLPRYYLDLADPSYRTRFAVYHQRYSTNTDPSWSLAQPFRMLAHNGEINTLIGNRNWMEAREKELTSELWGDELDDLLPILSPESSDSAMLDQLFELLVQSGRDPLHASAMLIPEAWEGKGDLADGLRGFYEYHSALVEPWDGPAAVVFSDGLRVGASLDRNGLRPLRYWITDDDLVVLGSEAGIVRTLPPETIRSKGRLGPGELFACDLENDRILLSSEIKEQLSHGPWRSWIDRQIVEPPKSSFEMEARATTDDEPWRRQTLFGFHREIFERILEPMAFESKIPAGSMGDDTPAAVLAPERQGLYRFFRQRFAQVTNPPIDALRERSTMTLRVMVGAWGSLLDGTEERAHLLHFDSPILDGHQLAWLRELPDPSFSCVELATIFEQGDDLERAVHSLCRRAHDAARSGATLLVLSDREASFDRLPIPMLLAVSAVHRSLIEAGLRMGVSLIADAGDAWEDHDLACLISFGATLVHPRHAYRSVRMLADEREADAADALSSYRAQLELGLLKIMSKMGIGPVPSYQGSQTFEILGLDEELVELYFGGTESRLGGVGAAELETELRELAAEAEAAVALPDRGIYRFRRQGESHAFSPTVVKAMHSAVRDRTESAWQRYLASTHDRPPVHIRDLLDFRRSAEPIELDEVEPISRIVRRFCVQAMSHGALSRESHELLAVVMNRLGGKSNSGEGGEDRSRFVPYSENSPPTGLSDWKPEPGDWGNSAIKQVASGRFGVSAEYLMTAREIEIKVAQGAKPGEGGQIPGHKVTAEIALIRHAIPGVPLISPPPHHDIYSIEDLAQLIYDLKRLNPLARVGVKLVAASGVGTIAAGVVKGFADVVTISGYDGGTGATPLSSQRHAGMPWELGLAETQQVLVSRRLRGRATLRVDGGLQTGRDVVIAALLGADEVGFGTAALVAAGCIMARRCHLGDCPVGIATQRPELRGRFPGTPEQVEAFFVFVAEDVRRHLAELGLPRYEDLVGRVDLLEAKSEALASLASRPDLSSLLYDPDPARRLQRRRLQRRNDRPEEAEPLDEVIAQDCEPSILSPRPLRKSYPITNRERSVGARLAGLIAQRMGPEGLPEGLLALTFLGTAGQSFGAFCARGMKLELEGEAQDYVGKGMSGGQIIVRLPQEARYASQDNVIIGNTVLYGATGGSLYAAGRVGERMAVRNSGARAVIEGCGDHGCEYMTGGVVVILGTAGRNFGAGMSGGLAFVLDLEASFDSHINPGSVRLERIETEVDSLLLRRLVERHLVRTGSQRAGWILERWQFVLRRFWKVSPDPSVVGHGAHTPNPKTLELDQLEQLAAEP